MTIRLTVEEATELAEVMEVAGVDTTQLREVVESMKQEEQTDDDSFVKSKWDVAEHSVGSCVLCHQETKLAAGVCSSCFRQWALSCKPEKGK